ncbi:MAG: hypothetical protein IIZ93_06975 [Acidaminococcaceae bacterium]|nr:hypothetical protein [Acidaminococcaceae bacterium]
MMLATSQCKEKFEDYEGFVEKFKPKKTTDDCYTPPLVYEAVADWAANEYGLDKSRFCRPFYPGGDYERFDYDGRIVVDNPPFSILSQIVKNYIAWGVKFFLFAPTLAGLVRLSDFCAALAVDAHITYENGATVPTSFITNLEPESIRMRTPPTLCRAVNEANDKSRKEMVRQIPKYSYPLNVVTSAVIYPYSKYGIDFVIPRKESVRIPALDAQRLAGKKIFGNGLLISDNVKAEREKAEREKAEREKAEREKAERWELSERELNIIAALNQQGGFFLPKPM